MTEENNNNPLENTDENNPENRNEEYHPNFVRLEPDIGLGDHSQQQEDRKRRNHDVNRREDGPISFRHFLQNDTGLASSSASATVCPDLYRCSRQERSNLEAAVTDPESPVLPDFVQDNLALEHIYFNSDFNSKVLPDFTPHESGDGFREQFQVGASGHRYDENPAQASGRSSRNRIPLDLPVPNFFLDNEPRSASGSSLPFDLTTQTGNVASLDDVRSPTETELSGTGGRLPDFLSDGHILGHGNARHRDARIITSENGTGIDANPERHNLILTLRQENNRLRDDLSILQSVLMKKDDRIKELEDLVMALEISKLQMSSDANTQTMTQNKASYENEVSMLRKELESAKEEISRLKKGKLDIPAESYNDASTSSRGFTPSREQLTTKMKQMTSASEQLVQQLMKVINDMKSDFNITDEELKSFDDSSFEGKSPSRDQGGPSSSLQ